MAALKQQLEEAKKLKDQAEKSKMQAEEDKVRAEKERDEAERYGYDVGIVETEDLFEQRSPPCAVHTAPRLGKKPSTELGLKLLLS